MSWGAAGPVPAILAWICDAMGIRLGTHPNLQTGDPEDLNFTRSIKKIALRNFHSGQPFAVCPRRLRQFERAVVKFHRGVGSRHGLWGWKFPETYLLAPFVAEALPRSRWIHLVRDGRDVSFKNHLTDDPTRRLGRALLRHVGVLDHPHHVQAARSWEFQVRAFTEYRAQIDHISILELRFEQLLEDPESCIARLSEFLEADCAEPVREWISVHIKEEKLAQYLGEDARKVREIEDAIGPTLKIFGYL